MKRAISKRLLDKAANDAISSVDSRALFSPDVKELAKRIQLALEERHTTTLPVDEVLHLLRLVCMVIEAGKEHTGATVLTRISARKYEEISAENLTWSQAMLIVNRSNRFVRLVRALAYAPGARPPRLVKIPIEAQTLFAAQRHNPRWCEETFETVGKGSKCCVQLFRWLNAMMEVAVRQEQFLGYIANVFRDWLPHLLEIQQASRRLEFDLAIMERHVGTFEESMKPKRDDIVLTNLMQQELRKLTSEMGKLQEDLKRSQEAEEELRESQLAKETTALLASYTRVKEK